MLVGMFQIIIFSQSLPGCGQRGRYGISW